jgi:hypothetical protein
MKAALNQPSQRSWQRVAKARPSPGGSRCRPHRQEALSRVALKRSGQILDDEPEPNDRGDDLSGRELRRGVGRCCGREDEKREPDVVLVYSASEEPQTRA